MRNFREWINRFVNKRPFQPQVPRWQSLLPKDDKPGRHQAAMREWFRHTAEPEVSFWTALEGAEYGNPVSVYQQRARLRSYEIHYIVKYPDSDRVGDFTTSIVTPGWLEFDENFVTLLHAELQAYNYVYN